MKCAWFFNLGSGVTWVAADLRDSHLDIFTLGAALALTVVSVCALLVLRSHATVSPNQESK